MSEDKAQSAVLRARLKVVERERETLSSALNVVCGGEPPEGWGPDPSCEEYMAEYGSLELLRRELGMNNLPDPAEDLDAVLRVAADFIVKAMAGTAYGEMVLESVVTDDWAVVGRVHGGEPFCLPCATASHYAPLADRSDELCVGASFIKCAKCGCAMLVE